MSHLRIKTTCDRGSKSRDKKVFTFCQDGQCCSTSPLPFQNENCNEEHFYQGTEIGECTQFKFGFDNKIEGNVTYKDLPPEEDIQLFFKDGSVTVCSIVNYSNPPLPPRPPPPPGPPPPLIPSRSESPRFSQARAPRQTMPNELKFLDFVCKEPKGILCPW